MSMLKWMRKHNHQCLTRWTIRLLMWLCGSISVYRSFFLLQYLLTHALYYMGCLGKLLLFLPPYVSVVLISTPLLVWTGTKELGVERRQSIVEGQHSIGTRRHIHCEHCIGLNPASATWKLPKFSNFLSLHFFSRETRTVIKKKKSQSFYKLKMIHINAALVSRSSSEWTVHKHFLSQSEKARTDKLLGQGHGVNWWRWTVFDLSPSTSALLYCTRVGSFHTSQEFALFPMLLPVPRLLSPRMLEAAGLVRAELKTTKSFLVCSGFIFKAMKTKLIMKVMTTGRDYESPRTPSSVHSLNRKPGRWLGRFDRYQWNRDARNCGIRKWGEGKKGEREKEGGGETSAK